MFLARDFGRQPGAVYPHHPLACLDRASRGPDHGIACGDDVAFGNKPLFAARETGKNGLRSLVGTAALRHWSIPPMPSTRAERPRTLDPYLGAVLAGRHRIERLIGRGGMGLVYLATDIVNGGELVIKLLAPHWMEDSTAVSRFDREGKRLQELAHPNVVKMLE